MNQGLKAGAAAVTEVIVLGNLMDIMKMEKQRDCHQDYVGIYRKLARRGFIRANLIGLFPWGIAMYGVRGAGYGVGSCLGKEQLGKAGVSGDALRVGASGIGGALEGALTTPLSMMRTRVAQVGGLRASFDSAAVLRSAPVSAGKRSCDWMLRTVMYSRCRPYFSDNIAAFMAGVCSAILTIPIDRLLPLMQQTNPPKNVFSALASDVKIRGMHAVMAGATMRVLHGGWHTCFVFGALRVFGEGKRVSY